MEDNKNLSLYDKLKEVPSKYLKEIKAGRLKGMSDIKPQWRLQRLTEVLGPCGIGWKIQNLKFEYKEVGEEIVCNCYLEFLYKYDGEWSEPIPAIGGNKLATKEQRGVYVSDEAEKMAYTDAISVATKMIGLASDVYMGHGGKYDSGQTQTSTKQVPKSDEKQWLNIYDKNGKETEVFKKILARKEKETVTIDTLKQHFKISNEVIQELIKKGF